MNSRTSFFNKSIIRSDFRRLWWISALHTLGIFLFFTFLYLDRYVGDDGYWLYYGISDHPTFGNSNLYGMSPAFYVLAVLVPVGLSAFLFSYLQNNSSMTCLHGIPVARKTHYFSHLLSGGVMLLIPVLVNGLILLLFRAEPRVADSYRIVDLLWLLASGLIYELLSFTAASFVMMVVGNAFGGFLLTFALAALPAVAEAFVFYFCEQQLFGYVYNGDYSLTKFLYVLPHDLPYHGKWILYLVLSVIFILAGYGLYRIRNLENHSEMIAFPKLRPIFVCGVGICFGCGGYLYFSEILGSDNILLLIPIGVLGIVIAQMLVQKSFRILKSVYKPAIGFVCFVILMYGAFAIDLLGYEKNVPNPEQVASVSFQKNGVTSYSLTSDNRTAYTVDDYDYRITDPEELSMVARLHQRIVEERNDPNKVYDHGYGLVMQYTLKNGKTLVRQYQFDADQMSDVLMPVLTLPQLRCANFPILAENQRNYAYISIRDQRVPDEMSFSYRDGISDPQIISEVIEALKKDLSEVPVESYLYKNEAYTEIYVNFTQESRYMDNDEPVPEDKLGICNERYVIRKEYKNTIAVLEKIGFYDALPKADQIQQIEVRNYPISQNENPDTEAVVDAAIPRDVNPTTQTDGIIINDPKKLAKICQVVNSLYGNEEAPDTAELVIYYQLGWVTSIEIDSKDAVWNGLLDQ